MSVNSPHFEIVSYKDLFQKAKYDFTRFNELVNSYDLFNFLCTINHLYEWVLKETDLPKSVFPPFVEGSPLFIINQLCNRAKHFRKKASDPETRVVKGWGTGRWNKNTFGNSEPSYTVIVGNKEMCVLQLCKDSLEIWEQFFRDKNLI